MKVLGRGPEVKGLANEDVWQETLIKLLEKSDKIKNHQHLKNWLSRVARNIVKDNHRKIKNEIISFSDDEFMGSDIMQDHIFSGISEEGQNEKGIVLKYIKKYITQLTEIQKDMLERRYYLHFTERR